MSEAKEVVTASGLWIAQPEGVLRGWIKPPGEPAIIIAESPFEAIERIEAAQEAGDIYVVLHEWSYGQAVWMPMALMDKCSIQVTYKPNGRTTYGGIWAGNCPCKHCEASRVDA